MHLCITMLKSVLFIIFLSKAFGKCNPYMYTESPHVSKPSGPPGNLTFLPQDQGNQSPAALGSSLKLNMCCNFLFLSLLLILMFIYVFSIYLSVSLRWLTLWVLFCPFYNQQVYQMDNQSRRRWLVC